MQRKPGHARQLRSLPSIISPMGELAGSERARAPNPVSRVGRADREPGASLLVAMTIELEELYADLPGSLQSVPVTPDEMAPPHGSFVILSALANGSALACGGVRRLADGLCEIKRMYVVPEARGLGLGRRLLDALEDEARRLGYARVRLDTGPRQAAARSIYEGAGYRRIPDYNGNAYAEFWFEKAL